MVLTKPKPFSILQAPSLAFSRDILNDPRNSWVQTAVQNKRTVNCISIETEKKAKNFFIKKRQFLSKIWVNGSFTLDGSNRTWYYLKNNKTNI